MVFLGPPAPADRDNFESLAAVELNAHSIGVCTYAWQLRLQQNAASPNGLPRPGPCQIKGPQDVRFSFRAGFLFIHIAGPLLSPQQRYDEDKG